MKKILNWQKEILNQIPNMTNEELLKRYTSLSGGDTWDGVLTSRGEWEYKFITKELNKRLIECGFLQKES